MVRCTASSLPGMGLALIGVAIGLGGAVVLARVITSLLFGVAATDVSPLIVVAAAVTAIAALAAAIPAHRAARTASASFR